MNDTNVTRVARLETATLSDALDKLGINGQCHQIRPCADNFTMAGRAWTLRYGPAGKPAGTVGDYIDDVPPGHVIVLDNAGRDDVTVWGDILTEVAKNRSIAGTLIDGTNRDVSLCRELNYPVYSRHTWMRTGKDRVQVEATGVPVTIGKVRVAPGDLIKGDADGVIVIPQQHEEAVLAAAEAIHEAEEAIRRDVRGGMSLREARARHQYHSLQTKVNA